MTLQTPEQLASTIKQIKEQRKNGELTLKQYYGELLAILTNLSEALSNEVDNMNDGEIRSQVPLLMVLLDEQIRAFAERQ